MLWVVREDMAEWSGYAVTGIGLLLLRVPIVERYLPRVFALFRRDDKKISI
ncbi:hypothetical protein D3C85_1947920 [compost metagenome]